MTQTDRDSRMVFRGKPKDYADHLKRVIRKYEDHIENVYRATGSLLFDIKSRNEFDIRIGNVQIVNPGEQITYEEYPLIFTDGSILTLSQTLLYEQRSCWLVKSIIRFAKITPDHHVQYLFHYDTVTDIPDHPDHHLQFEYDPHTNTPRFPMYRCADLDAILQMIVRDRIAIYA